MAELAGAGGAATPPDVSATDDGLRDVHTSMPNVARIYDYLLGGTANLPADRDAAEELMRLVPAAAIAARDNRDFLQRAVKYLAASAGIRQYIDIGTGLPTQGNVHEVAQAYQPGSRVLYFDNDPVVVDQARSLLADNSTTIAINGDLRSPKGILDHPDSQALIDFDKPVAVLLVAILHFIGDDASPHEVVTEIMDVMPAGSYLVLSHVTADSLPSETTRKVRRLYDGAAASAAPRSRADIVRFFEGLEMLQPGLVNVASWRNGLDVAERDRVLFYAGVGYKRQARRERQA